MRRLISKIGVKSPVEVIKEREARVLVLPCYLQSWRRSSGSERETTVVVVKVSPHNLHKTQLWIEGRDQHQIWTWRGLYNTHGHMIARGSSSQYAPPARIFHNFVPSLLKDGYLDVKQAGGRPSVKQTYDLARWRRFKEGDTTERDDEWRTYLNEKQWHQFITDGTYPL